MLPCVGRHAARRLPPSGVYWGKPRLGKAALPWRPGLEPCNRRPQCVHVCGEHLGLRRFPRTLELPEFHTFPQGPEMDALGWWV